MKKISTHTRSQTTINNPLLSSFSEYTQADVFDLRCEYDVPRFIDLNEVDFALDTDTSEHQVEEFFNWF